ncbi:MAG: sigma-70 family polymerase sigma factor [Conexibacter sp.]|nr:sigma-70 family polymerase sigma factor [Conexibacter sp.]
MTAVPFQRFLDEQREPVFRFLVASVGRDGADDCFQETFLAAMKAYPRLRAGSNRRAWVLTIAHRKAMDHHRARKRNAIPVEDLPEVAHHDPPLQDDETWARVRALPPKQRAAVLLRYAGDLSHAEVAVALECSPDAARRSAHEGLKKLREEMSPTP